MAKIKHKDLKTDPILDLMYYLTLTGETRLEQALLDRFEQAWDDWRQHLRVVKLAESLDKDASGWLLAWLEKPVEDAVEAQWQASPKEGMAFHNLAICLVMAAAAQHVPELAEGGCAPLTEPSRDVRKAFERLGLEWKAEGTCNRTYAVFTPHPYAGGCERCYSKDTCMSCKDLNYTLGLPPEGGPEGEEGHGPQA